MTAEGADIPLTSLVSCGGCAAKYSAALLQELIGALPPSTNPDLLVGLAGPDDAAVFKLDEERAIVFTLDFFPPIVDDAADFGAIAASNAVSDIFAMGGEPLLALSIAAFPESLPTRVVARILAAAAAKVQEAGGVLAGGHTLRDDEPAYGLAVVGTVDPKRVWTKSGARPGDLLYLTKPLGTGLLVHAHEQGRGGTSALQEAVSWMTMLNRQASEILRPLEPNAVTDVTGFGLLGHAFEVAQRSEVGIRIDANALPALPSSLELAEAGVRTGGDRRNRSYVGDALTVEGAGEAQLALAFDPQTAGGLLIALPPERSRDLEHTMRLNGHFLAHIGRAVESEGVEFVG